MSGTFVIVGGGLAAATAAAELRARGYDGRLVVFAAEPRTPYERPPLSKGFLTGADTADALLVHPESWYADHDVDLRIGEAATALDPAARTVTGSGAPLAYDRLLIATGAVPRPLLLADEPEVDVAYLRTIDDSERLKSAFGPGRRVAVVGGGWIGLEVAAAARGAGCEVDLVESLELPLLRVLGPEVAQVFADVHRRHGVALHTGASLRSVGRTARGALLRLADGTSIEADHVVAGVGVAPATALAEAAGLATDNGILVDSRLATSAPGVFAAGDVANAEHPVLGRRLRVEHWDNAIEQGKVAARNMLGDDVAYERLPYFFTDQYDLGMEYLGSVGPEGYDEVVLRGDVAGPVFTSFWVRHGRVLAGMQVNDWDATDQLRRLVGHRVDIGSLRDPSTPLDQVETT